MESRLINFIVQAQSFREHLGGLDRALEESKHTMLIDRKEVTKKLGKKSKRGKDVR